MHTIELEQGISAITERIDLLRTECQRTRKARKRLSGAIEPQQSNAQAIMRIGILRRQAARDLVAAKGILRPPRCQQHQSQVSLRVRAASLERQRGTQELLSGVEPA